MEGPMGTTHGTEELVLSWACLPGWRLRASTVGLDSCLAGAKPRNSADLLWLGLYLARTRATSPPGASLVDLQHRGFHEVFNQAATLAGLDPLKPVVPYVMRHSGAGNDIVNRLRSRGEVKQRGRWDSDRTIKRYLKGVRVAEQINRFSWS